MGFRLTNDMRSVEDSPLPGQFFSQNQRSIHWMKRTLDVIIALFALIFLAPLILVSAMIVRLQDGGPIFFAQERIGRYGERFKCYKLRSMVPDAQARLEKILTDDPEASLEWEETQKLKNDARITPFGHFIRKTSIDELPQLFNVLMGNMSLVGPRPIVEAEITRYAEYFRQYCSVSPGITGLWQVQGRSDTTYAERVQLDVTYAETRTFWGDVKILVLTVPVVLLSRGAH